MSEPIACCQGASQSADAMAIDPVCGMQVNPATAKHVSVHDGQTFHFCSVGCKTKFEAAPASYLGASGKQIAAGSCCAGETVATPDHAAAGLTHEEKDPVCGMTVDPHTAKQHVEHAGHTYYFCGQRCSDKFIAEPLAWLEGHAAPGAIYTCPMHPEIQQVGPGECPKCGMALEPMLPREDENDGGEVRAMTRRFWLLVALTLPVFLLAMGPHLFGWQLPSPWDGITHWVEAVLGTAVVLWGGAPFFQRGWNSLRPWRPNMYTLIGVGTGVA